MNQTDDFVFSTHDESVKQIDTMDERLFYAHDNLMLFWTKAPREWARLTTCFLPHN